MVGAKRPGLEAFIAISEGMQVSITWLVGRAVDNLSPKLSQKDYAMSCFSVLSGLINWRRKEQAESKESIFGQGTISGMEDAEVAARSIPVFIEKVQLFRDIRDAVGLDRADLFHRTHQLPSNWEPAAK